MREILGQTQIAQALAEGRGKIESDTQKLLQTILDFYGAGIVVTQVQLAKVDPPEKVIDAFRDVQRALADRERLRNEAEAYRNDICRGPAATRCGSGRRPRPTAPEITARAQGDADRFLSVYKAFKQAEGRERCSASISKRWKRSRKTAEKIIIDKAVQGNTGVLPYLPLPELMQSASGECRGAVSSVIGDFRPRNAPAQRWSLHRRVPEPEQLVIELEQGD